MTTESGDVYKQVLATIGVHPNPGFERDQVRDALSAMVATGTPRRQIAVAIGQTYERCRYMMKTLGVSMCGETRHCHCGCGRSWLVTDGTSANRKWYEPDCLRNHMKEEARKKRNIRAREASKHGMSEVARYDAKPKDGVSASRKVRAEYCHRDEGRIARTPCSKYADACGEGCYREDEYGQPCCYVRGNNVGDRPIIHAINTARTHHAAATRSPIRSSE